MQISQDSTLEKILQSLPGTVTEAAKAYFQYRTAREMARSPYGPLISPIPGSSSVTYPGYVPANYPPEAYAGPAYRQGATQWNASNQDWVFWLAVGGLGLAALFLIMRK